MKTSSFSRALELAKLAAQIGLKEMKSGDLNSRLEQAVLIAKSLSQLKGAAMKMGQILSLDLDDYFPPEAIQILSQLQSSAISQPFEEIEKILNEQLPKEKRKLITSISRTPIGVASIGQVHRAKFQGRDIVLKVQFAEVANSVDSDLNILRTLATTFCRLSGRKMDLEPLFNEFKSLLQQELNYEEEAKFQNLFAEKITELNSKSVCQYRVPEVIPEISTPKVLAMSFEPGLAFRQWANSKPSKEEKQKVAIGVLDLYFHEFFEWGLVQTDPNWGNFLVQNSGDDLRLCLLDFGATRTYSRAFIQNYIALLDSAAKNDSEEMKKLAIEFGMMDPRESATAFKAFEEMLKTSIKPFFKGNQAGSSVFDFSDRNHALDSQMAVKALSKELVYSPPPYSIIFLHRKLAGVYSILKSLEIKTDISPYWQMMKDFSKLAPER